MNRLPYVSIILNSDRFKINQFLTYHYNDVDVVYRLRGIVYATNGHHFVSRYFSGDGHIWFHDGIRTERHCKSEGFISDTLEDEWLMNMTTSNTHRQAVMVLYARN